MCRRNGTVSLLCCHIQYIKNGNLMKENKHLLPKVNKVFSGVETKCAKGKVFFILYYSLKNFTKLLSWEIFKLICIFFKVWTDTFIKYFNNMRYYPYSLMVENNSLGFFVLIHLRKTEFVLCGAIKLIQFYCSIIFILAWKYYHSCFMFVNPFFVVHLIIYC